MALKKSASLSHSVDAVSAVVFQPVATDRIGHNPKEQAMFKSKTMWFSAGLAAWMPFRQSFFKP